MRTGPFLVAFVICALCAFTKAEGQTGTNVQNMRMQKIPLLSLLGDIGDKYDIQLTLEYGWDQSAPGTSPLAISHSERRCPISGKCDSTLPDKNSADQELAAIELVEPTLTHRWDSSTPKIVHVIDSRLGNLSDYVMNADLKAVKYQGTLCGLAAYLKSNGVSVVCPGGGGISDMGLLDFRTLITIDAQQITVRDAFSNYVPLKRRARMLWISQTNLLHVDSATIKFPTKVKDP